MTILILFDWVTFLWMALIVLWKTESTLQAKLFHLSRLRALASQPNSLQVPPDSVQYLAPPYQSCLLCMKQTPIFYESLSFPRSGYSTLLVQAYNSPKSYRIARLAPWQMFGRPGWAKLWLLLFNSNESAWILDHYSAFYLPFQNDIRFFP